MSIPEKPTLDGIEARLIAEWDENGTYRFDRTATRDQIFAIDTPPPTVSGSLHVGHVFSYTQTDTLARYQRMRGRVVFYPIGWDDNGLATERRVQNFFGVRCDPSIHFDPGFTPPSAPGAKSNSAEQVPISRPNFVELCKRLVADDEVAFEELFRRLGLSVDWDYLYTTIGDHCVRTSQQAFLHNLDRGEAYQQDAPTLWDVDYRTAVAQAELVDKELPGAYHSIAFALTSGEGSASDEPHGGSGGSERSERTPDPTIVVATTRPELIASCCALVAHPEDARYQPLFGSTVVTPLYGVEVPVVAHPLADPEKGTGVAMICTFGDTTDVTWWRELNLPTRALVGRDGRLAQGRPEWITSESGAAAYAEIAGLTTKQAQKRVVEQLRDSGALQGDPRPITHPVKFYEKGDRPLEIVTSRQWYIRNGGRDADLRAQLLKRGEELRWFPDHMRHRYANWVEGLNGDWLISRQRYFGVPFPLWYRLDADGNPQYDEPLRPSLDRLPIDPSNDVPDGYTEDQRGAPNGFVGDPDIMDTWATSSLTPQIAGRWIDDPDLFSRVFPMDIRPQAHDIIRTWLFATVVRAHFEHDSLPWWSPTISGWILDPDRKKMSKSVGNVITPMPLLEQYGSDAVRYWAVSARLGVDTAFDESQMKIGRKLALKILNASKFVLGLPEAATGATTSEHVDVAMLGRLRGVVADATAAFDEHDYARALERVEQFFWWFCDDFVELVKTRAYGSQGPAAAASASASLRQALDAVLRLFAPFVPFVTDEVWQWWHEGSIHETRWPSVDELPASPEDGDATLDAVSEVLAIVRRAKTEAKVSQRAPVAEVVVRAPADFVRVLAVGERDLLEAGSIARLDTADADALSADVTLAAP